ncbi:sensor histidine kinase [Phenylobacterium sp.]|jgi:PAS domain S-box-containing protein|uniref:sensor histidine kinase n=1 Tax=Phenylobacterium sp. TaxID=1871053 RepID=UPI002F922FBE
MTSQTSLALSPAAAPRSDELSELRLQLAEALETLDAIRNGEVDALVVGGDHNRQVYTLETADRSYRLLIEQMTDGALMIDRDGAVLYGNRALADMLRTTTGRLIGKGFGAFVAPESAQDFQRLLQKGGKAEVVLARRGDAGTFVAQLSLTKMDPRDGRLLCGVLTDLTATYAQAREVADARSVLAVEAAHRESDERYRLILEGASDYAIMATDLDEKVTIWNAGAQQILGWPASELIGRAFPAIWTVEDIAAGADERERALCLESGRAEEERWHLRKDGASFWSHTLMMPLRKDDGRLIGFLRILRDRTAQRASDEKQSLLVNELNHRVKNTLATVQSIAAQTLRSAPSAEQGRAALEERLLALSRAHDVLTRESWEGAELSEIVALAVSPYLGSDVARIVTHGPSLRLPPRMALAIAMALQELATNAAKYGALSAPLGRLSIVWTHEARVVRLRWEEKDGPLVAPPLRRGFGSRLIERSLAAELGGEAAIDFAPTGVVCVITGAVEAPGKGPRGPAGWSGDGYQQVA